MYKREEIDYKTSPPKIKCEVVSRPRLNKTLDKGSLLRASFVTAPAGYGKTTLLIDYVEKKGISTCWYSLTPVDNNPVFLLAGIVKALCRKFPHLQEELEFLLYVDNGQTKDFSDGIKKLSIIIEQLVSDDFSFIIEDFGEIEGNLESSHIIEDLLSFFPDNCHFIITGRSNIPLRFALELIMRKRAIRINTSMLAFTDNEIKELISRQYEIELSEEETKILSVASGGWPITLLLDTDGVVNNDTERSGSIALAENEIFNFFESELFKNQSQGVKNFLLETSLLDGIDLSIYKKVNPRVNSNNAVKCLKNQNLLSEQKNSKDKVYKYHPLFRKFLRSNLKQNNEKRYFNLNNKLAAIYRDEGKVDKAIEYNLLAMNYNAAVQLIKNNGEFYMAAGKWEILANWIKLIPVKLRDSHVEIRILHARCLIHLGFGHESIETLSRVIKTLEGKDSTLIVAEALSWRSAAFRLAGNFKEAKKDILESISILEVNGEPVILTGEAYRRLGSIFMEQNQPKRALKHLKHALSIYSKEHVIDKMADLHNTIGIAYKIFGNLHKANVHYELAREGWEKTKNIGALSSTLNNMGAVYQRLEQYELAFEVLNEGLSHAKKAGYLRMQACILIALAEVRRDTDDYEEAIKLYNQGLLISRDVMESYFVAHAIAGLGKTYMLKGDNRKAEILARDAINYASEKGQEYDASVFQLDFAAIKLNEGDLESAKDILEETIDSIKKTGDKDALARGYFYLAKVAFCRKDYGACCKKLSLLLEVADEIGYDNFLVLEGKNEMPLLQYGAIKFPKNKRFENAIKRLSDKRNQQMNDLKITDLDSELEFKTQDIKVEALGTLKVSYSNSDSTVKAKWHSNKAKEFFLYLLLNSDGRSKEQIIDAIWPDANLDNADNNFHVTLFRIRNALFPHVFTKEKCLYKVNENFKIWFDVVLFEDCSKKAEAIKSQSEDRIKLLEKAVTLYKGSFMDEFYSEWIDLKRNELETKYLRVLSSLANCYEERGETEKEIRILEKLISEDHYQEDAYKKLINCYKKLGDNIASKNVYKKYIKYIVDEMEQEEVFDK